MRTAFIRALIEAARGKLATIALSVRQENPAVRLYERAGFRWLRIWQDPLIGPAWLLLKERPR